MIARQLTRTLKPVDYDVIGADARHQVKTDGNMYKGPDWFIQGANEDIYTGIYR